MRQAAHVDYEHLQINRMTHDTYQQSLMDKNSTCIENMHIGRHKMHENDRKHNANHHRHHRHQLALNIFPLTIREKLAHDINLR